jgi:hypothetical protein
MWFECEFKNDTFYFKSNKIKCAISTEDYRPKGNLSEFYHRLKNKLSCTIDFNNNDKMITISYPQYCYDYYSNNNIKIEMDGVIVIVSYDSCFEVICEFLNNFVFKNGSDLI